MVFYQCKNCGGKLIPNEDGVTGTCDHCDGVAILPNGKEEERIMAANRANKLRLNCEFDRAIQAYEKLIQENDSDAELYWNLLICKYGIEYVKDPVTNEYKPTCHRARYESVVSDMNYQEVMKYASPLARNLYEKQAKEIDEILQSILAKAARQDKYDVFISYKETDNGERTEDSTFAERIYDKLKGRGLKVFYAPESLTLGTNYEAEIFSALQSSKVMILLASRVEYMNAVWVKNEWSRFLELINQGKDKYLIPAYWEMDPAEDFPTEIKNHRLQGINLGSTTGEFTLLQNVEKLIGKKDSAKRTSGAQSGNTASGNPAESLCSRGYIFLKNRQFEEAAGAFNRSLDSYAEYSVAYWGLLLAQRNVIDADELIASCYAIDDNPNYKNAVSFSSGEEKENYINICEAIKTSAHTKKKMVHDKMSQKQRNIIAQLKEKQLQIGACEKEYASCVQLLRNTLNSVSSLGQQCIATTLPRYNEWQNSWSEYKRLVAEFDKCTAKSSNIFSLSNQIKKERSHFEYCTSSYEKWINESREANEMNRLCETAKRAVDNISKNDQLVESLNSDINSLYGEYEQLKKSEKEMFNQISVGKLEQVDIFLRQ